MDEKDILKWFKMDGILYIVLVITLVICINTLQKVNHADDICQETIKNFVNNTPCVESCFAGTNYDFYISQMYNQTYFNITGEIPK